MPEGYALSPAASLCLKLYVVRAVLTAQAAICSAGKQVIRINQRLRLFSQF